MEEAVLLNEGLLAISRGLGLLCLESHVRVRDLWDIGDEEDEGENKDENCDGEIHPLNILERFLVAEVEEDIGS